jgi:hypothetical protein
MKTETHIPHASPPLPLPLGSAGSTSEAGVTASGIPPRTDADRLTWLIAQGPPGAAEHDLVLSEEAWDLATSFVSDECRTDQVAMRLAIDDLMDNAKEGAK